MIDTSVKCMGRGHIYKIQDYFKPEHLNVPMYACNQQIFEYELLLGRILIAGFCLVLVMYFTNDPFATKSL